MIHHKLYTRYYWYYILGIIGVKFHYYRYHLSTLNICQQQILILHRNQSPKIPNSVIIATQIGPDIENSEDFTHQIISSIQ